MKAIFKFANGAEEVVQMNGELFPEIFRINTPEGIAFYFAYMDTLPSGAIFFKEVSRDQAHAIWREE
jgi:hypothetical protein